MSVEPSDTSGTRRWIVCLLSGATLAGLTGVVYSFGVFFTPLQETFGVSSDRVSLIFSLNTLLTYVVGIYVGYLADRHPAHRLLLAGMACWTGGLVLTALWGSYLGVLLAFGLFVALGMGIPYITLYATVARWFDRRRGLALSVLSVGFGTGGLVGPPVTEALLSRFDWGTTFLVLAVPTTALVLLTTLAVFITRTDRRRMDGDTITTEDGDANSNTGESADGPGLRSLLAVFTAPRVLLVTAGFVFGFYAFYALLVHFVPYAESVGVSRRTAAIALGLIGGASIPARLLAGHVSDLYGRIPVLLIGFVLMTTATLGLIVWTTATWFLVLAVVFGAGNGAVAALYSPIVVEIFDLGTVGTMLGVTSVSFGIAGVLGPYATGVLVAATGTYAVALVLAAAMLVLGSACIVLASSVRFN